MRPRFQVNLQDQDDPASLRRITACARDLPMSMAIAMALVIAAGSATAVPDEMPARPADWVLATTARGTTADASARPRNRDRWRVAREQSGEQSREREVDRLVAALVSLDAHELERLLALPTVPLLGRERSHEEPISLRPSSAHGALAASPVDPVIHRLVELGPHAIAALVTFVEDPRPTAAMVHRMGHGRLWHGSEFPINRAIARERETLTRRALVDSLAVGVGSLSAVTMEATVESHTVTHGDLCFALLGHIVNRPYAVVHPRRALGASINSPPVTTDLADAARELWGQAQEGEHAALLLDSLLDDFATRGIGSDEMQVGALLRLLTWFPEESIDPVLARIDDLTLRTPHAADDATAKPNDRAERVWWLSNAAPSGFLQTAALIDHPEVAVRIAALLVDVEEVDCLADAISAPVAEAGGEALRDRLLACIRDQECFSGCATALRPLVRHWPDAARPLVGELVARGEVVAVLEATAHLYGRIAWIDETLLRLLDDSRIVTVTPHFTQETRRLAAFALAATLDRAGPDSSPARGLTFDAHEWDDQAIAELRDRLGASSP